MGSYLVGWWVLGYCFATHQKNSIGVCQLHPVPDCQSSVGAGTPRRPDAEELEHFYTIIRIKEKPKGMQRVGLEIGLHTCGGFHHSTSHFPTVGSSSLHAGTLSL
jgi:hypothetical protein